MSGVARARSERGRMNAGNGWKRVRERTRRRVSSVRWVYQGGGRGEDEVIPVSRREVDLGGGDGG